jgi:hypothetical protein
MNHTANRSQVSQARKRISHSEKHHADGRHHRHPRAAERARQVGPAVAQHDHRDAHDHEGQQDADVGQLGRLADRQEAGDQRGRDAEDPGDPGRRVVLRVGLGQPGRQQPVAAHRVADPGGAHQEGEQHGQDAQDRAGGDDRPEERQPDVGEGRGERRRAVDPGVVDHAGEHQAGQHVEHHRDGQRVDDGLGHVLLRFLGLLGRGGHRVVAEDREEHRRRAGERAGQAERGERVRSCRRRCRTPRPPRPAARSRP